MKHQRPHGVIYGAGACRSTATATLYGGGRCRPGDRPASPAETLAFYAALRAPVADFESLPRADKALLLAAADMAGKTAQQAEAAFSAAEAAFNAALEEL